MTASPLALTGSSGLEEVDDVCTKMTDAHFKEYCYENFDADNDGKVSMKEAELVTEIDCSTAEDFTGIEYFTNLESFTSQSVKYIDLSRNILLSYICLRYSQIEILDLSHNVNLTELPEFAFCYCDNLLSVTLPENLTTIGSYAFEYCSNLASVSFPENLTTIGDNAFYNTYLTSVTSNATTPPTVGSYAFSNILTSTLYVPSGSEDAYANSDWTQWFANFLPIE